MLNHYPVIVGTWRAFGLALPSATLSEVSDWSSLWDARKLGFLAWIFNNDFMFYATYEIKVIFSLLLGQSIRWFCRHLYSTVGMCALFLWFLSCPCKVLLLILDDQTFFSSWNLCPCSLYKRFFYGPSLANCAGIFFFGGVWIVFGLFIPEQWVFDTWVLGIHGVSWT